MTSIRPLLALALPAVLAAACAGQPAPKAATPNAPGTSSSPGGSSDASGRTEGTPDSPELQTQAKSTDKAGAAKKKTTAVAGGAKAKKKAKKKLPIVYNNKMPKGFKRYNAKGVINVNKLIYPRREVVGVFTDDHLAGSPVSRANTLGNKIGIKPNMIKTFVNWGGGYDVNWARTIWSSGAIPQFELELHSDDISLRDVANGEQDDYIRRLAQSIKQSNVPVSFSAFHEFNGDWYDWGYCGKYNAGYAACQKNPRNTPTDFKRAWVRMHKIFTSVGATNAIWLWQANQAGARPNVPLKPFWPGASYVDWVGVVGYYQNPSKAWIHTFDKIFVPTFVQVRKFTKKPIIIPEVGSWASSRRNADIKDFLTGIANYPNVIGFEWFNMNKAGTNDVESDWRIDWNQSSVNTFRTYLKKGHFGFNVKRPAWSSGK
jgi:mannan endo-1,4-beta-mannosidase